MKDRPEQTNGAMAQRRNGVMRMSILFYTSNILNLLYVLPFLIICRFNSEISVVFR
jgi:hypothetical protein